MNSDPQEDPMDVIHQIMILYASKESSMYLMVKSRDLVEKECKSITKNVSKLEGLKIETCKCIQQVKMGSNLINKERTKRSVTRS